LGVGRSVEAFKYFSRTEAPKSDECRRIGSNRKRGQGSIWSLAAAEQQQQRQQVLGSTFGERQYCKKSTININGLSLFNIVISSECSPYVISGLS
jgi:hypothetical protein